MAIWDTGSDSAQGLVDDTSETSQESYFVVPDP